MVGNIWLYSSITVATILSTSVAYKLYNDIQDAKNVQQSLEIISQIKERIAKQYKINPEDVTRDQIIAYLPKGPNWEKVLLASRATGNTLNNSEALVDEDGNFVLNEDERIKLLAVNAKLRESGIENTAVVQSNRVTFRIGTEEKNFSYEDNIISNSVVKTIEIIYLNKNSIATQFNSIISANTPYDDIYHDMKKTKSESLSYAEENKRKEAYFKKRIKEKLISSKNSRDIEIYELIKDKL